MTSRLLRAGSRVAAVLLATLPAAACGPKLLNALVPEDGYRVERDLAYGDDPRQRLDVYVPDGLAGPAPVALFFYGGRWQAGDKDQFQFVGQALASRGFVTVIPDYRRHPEVGFPRFVEDGAAAIAWVRDHGAELGGDPEAIHLLGHSAGAHIAALLALDHDYLAAAGVAPDAIRSFVGLAGPYDFLPLDDPTLELIFAVEDLAATQPITFAGHARAAGAAAARRRRPDGAAGQQRASRRGPRGRRQPRRAQALPGPGPCRPAGRAGRPAALAGAGAGRRQRLPARDLARTPRRATGLTRFRRGLS